MDFSINTTIGNEKLMLIPLQEKDFDDLYAVASDPKIWEQHPNKDRCKIDQFRIFFNGAMQSKGAFKVVDKVSGKTIGSTRFYDYDKEEDVILIGYTFYGTEYWGKGINHAAKTLMLDYIFQFVSKVYFHIGSDNIRSQIAISRLGTTKIGEEEIKYFGEQPKMNCIYRLTKEEWRNKSFVK